jgi:hypothetical protein
MQDIRRLKIFRGVSESGLGRMNCAKTENEEQP